MAIENTFGKNIIPENDEQRIDALRRYRIIDTPSEESFDNIATLATKIFQTPIALVSLIDAERVFFKANVGMGKMKSTSRGKSLCALAIMQPGVTVFENALKEPCLIANPNVAGEFGLRFYAGAPIITHDGYMIGTLCIIDKEPRTFSYQEQEVLSGLARLVIDQFELRLSAMQEIDNQQIINMQLVESELKLVEVNEKLYATNEELSASNEELRSINEEMTLVAGQLALVSNFIPQQVWTATPDGLLDFVNNQTVEFFGKDAKYLIGENWIEAVHPTDLEAAGRAWTSSLQTGEPYQTEFRLLAKDGTFVWHLARAIPSKQDGRIVKWFGTNTDIDGQKRLEQQKNDFISIASHELKTPLTSLKATLQLLNRIKDNPPEKILPKLIEQANRGIQKIIGLVDDLLSVSRMNEGQLHLNRNIFVAGEIIAASCEYLKAEGIHNLVFEGDQQVQIVADEHLIEQVIVNLINNAVKYAPQSKEIRLKVEHDICKIKVSVTDSGPGIAPEKLPHLFERYYRVDHSGRQYSGLGLGLYICAEIIKKHAGEIGVESQPGYGSTFWFTLPIK